jgi:SanA protein
MGGIFKERRAFRGCLRITLYYFLPVGVLLVSIPVALRWWTDHRYKTRIYTPETVPPMDVAIVFGAGVWPSGRLSDILADRMDTAIELYRQGKVKVLLLTGDNRRIDYNEPQDMHDYAVARGVPSEDIVLDYAGRRTYDSCYRARHIFGVSQAILVTQAYHLDRALFSANHLGIDAIGVAADHREYVYLRYYWLRELLATPVAWWEVFITHPQPILGEPMPIFLDEDDRSF